VIRFVPRDGFPLEASETGTVDDVAEGMGQRFWVMFSANARHEIVNPISGVADRCYTRDLSRSRMQVIVGSQLQHIGVAILAWPAGDRRGRMISGRISIDCSGFVTVRA